MDEPATQSIRFLPPTLQRQLRTGGAINYIWAKESRGLFDHLCKHDGTLHRNARTAMMPGNQKKSSEKPNTWMGAFDQR
jgi:hypothetical protein